MAIENTVLMRSLNDVFVEKKPPRRRGVEVLYEGQKKSLKLAIVTETWYPDINGVAHSIGHIVTHLLELGVDVSLYYIGNRGRDKSEIEIDQRIHYTAMKGFKLPFYNEVNVGLLCTKKFKKIWEQNTPDIVQIVTEGPLGFSAMRAAKCLNISVVSDYHTNFQLYSRFYKLGFLQSLVSGYLRRLHNQAEITLVPTQQLKEQLEIQGFHGVEIMARGIDTAVFNPAYRNKTLRQSWGVTNDDLVVLYVGRIAAEKNIELAVRAYRQLQKKHSNSKFVLVGDGPLREKLEKENPDFIFCGMQRGQNLSEHYASGDLFLAPSITETFGNTILEAMASGLAVVCYDYASALEYIQNKENGIKVPFNHEGDFIDASVSLSTNRNLISKLRRNAEISMQGNSWREISERLQQRLIHLLETS